MCANVDMFQNGDTRCDEFEHTLLYPSNPFVPRSFFRA